MKTNKKVSAFSISEYSFGASKALGSVQKDEDTVDEPVSPVRIRNEYTSSASKSKKGRVIRYY